MGTVEYILLLLDSMYLHVNGY